MSDGSEKAFATLRPFQPSDLQGLHELDVECFQPPFRFSLSDLKQFVEDPCALTLVAPAPGGFAGFIIIHLLRQDGERFGYVVTLDVRQEQRRAGLGLHLIREAESLVQMKGVGSMRLHVFAGNGGARRFYEILGYRELGRVDAFYGQGRDALILVKDLDGR